MTGSQGSFDYLIVGGGIIGLSVARELRQRFPRSRVVLIEKEAEVGRHASGRNSGVLHAGFYYSADSLKARFTRDGNQAMRTFCKERKLRMNECGKVVVASDASELASLDELKRRGDRNGVKLEWIDPGQLSKIDPNVRTHERALWSPTTATVDPVEVCLAFRRDVEDSGVDVRTEASYVSHIGNTIRTSKGPVEAGYVVNCAGLYADRIAKDFGYSKHFVILPFKGVYLKDSKAGTVVKTNVYPVPNLANPFLGVHFTVTVDGTIKIGPTAIPAFWRENYKGLSRFKLGELVQIGLWELRLLLTNAFGFRDLAVQEFQKYSPRFFQGLAAKMVKSMSAASFDTWSRPGIRAQLLDIRSSKLVQDFVVEGDECSFHVLNAVSPAFTCAIPMGRFIVDQIAEKCDTGRKGVGHETHQNNA